MAAPPALRLVLVRSIAHRVFAFGAATQLRWCTGADHL